MVTHEFKRVPYSSLNSKQQEGHNFQKVSAVLADYGFVTIRLSSDWHGADFIAQHVDGTTFLKIQLKGRLTFDKKYLGRDLHICFPHGGNWYIYPHDELLNKVLDGSSVRESKSWKAGGGYSFPTLSKKLKDLLAAHRVGGT
jgi:hypothetical protein